MFTADFNVTAGRQFDRTAIVDLGYVNIYFGTTPEPRSNLSPTWHVERDETDYAALFSSPQTGHVILGNVVNNTYTGVISGSAQLEFYSSPENDKAHNELRADAVLPLTQSNGQGGINEPAFLLKSADQLATAFTLPRNIERAYLDVITQSQINDEFWYTCVPNDEHRVSRRRNQHRRSPCRRRAGISVDLHGRNRPVFLGAHSGGSGFEFLSLPHRFDAVRGCVEQRAAAHDCAVYNADDYFSATGTLLVYLDHGAQQVTGQVTENTIESGPTPTINENVQTDSSGNITGTVKTTSSRQFKAAGFVNTSHGRVDTQVKQTVNFKK